ncbi:hypothetical protein [Dendronalium sp. ChiSLP03b]|uniref:hypothetical protein n=1 Tax=Dendronalium sp. ChiSLP03b TaxID=3075381 RepID=UPI002AD2F661|nr:hypothetical protein [Dendronalium sp. ChiSLP03b]MDZ8207335.1 hypothetical protein [Dendronalium sp. ChiSLP03b]
MNTDPLLAEAERRTTYPHLPNSTIAWIPEDSGSWALPLRHERITSWENPIQRATWQLQQVCENLPTRPISVWDSEYGCAPFVLKTANIKADILVRLRSNLCLWGPPPPYSGKGRPSWSFYQLEIRCQSIFYTSLQSKVKLDNSRALLLSEVG